MPAIDYAIRVQGLSKLYRIGMQDQISDSVGGALLQILKRPLSNFRKYKSLYNFDDVISGAADETADHAVAGGGHDGSPEWPGRYCAEY